MPRIFEKKALSSQLTNKITAAHLCRICAKPKAKQTKTDDNRTKENKLASDCQTRH